MGGLTWIRARFSRWIVFGAPSRWRCAKNNFTFPATGEIYRGSNDPYRTLLNLTFHNKTKESPEDLHQALIDLLKKYVNQLFLRQNEDFKIELVQLVSFKIWSNAGKCKGDSEQSILSWIKKIVYTSGVSLLRDGERLDQFIDLELNDSDDEGNSTDDGPLDNAINLWGVSDHSERAVEDDIIYRELIQSWIDKMTPQEHKVFVYRMYEYSKTEIAAKLGVSKPRVTQLIEQIDKKCTGS
jgi:RNA polymerase sigma factor (sigma-70 family)